ncbi:MAG: hypothetical protein ABIH87_04475 [bacterium]
MKIKYQYLILVIAFCVFLSPGLVKAMGISPSGLEFKDIKKGTVVEQKQFYITRSPDEDHGSQKYRVSFDGSGAKYLSLKDNKTGVLEMKAGERLKKFVLVIDASKAEEGSYDARVRVSPILAQEKDAGASLGIFVSCELSFGIAKQERRELNIENIFFYYSQDERKFKIITQLNNQGNVEENIDSIKITLAPADDLQNTDTIELNKGILSVGPFAHKEMRLETDIYAVQANKNYQADLYISDHGKILKTQTVGVFYKEQNIKKSFLQDLRWGGGLLETVRQNLKLIGYIIFVNLL